MRVAAFILFCLLPTLASANGLRPPGAAAAESTADQATTANVGQTGAAMSGDARQCDQSIVIENPETAQAISEKAESDADSFASRLAELAAAAQASVATLAGAHALDQPLLNRAYFAKLCERLAVKAGSSAELKPTLQTLAQALGVPYPNPALNGGPVETPAKGETDRAAVDVPGAPPVTAPPAEPGLQIPSMTTDTPQGGNQTPADASAETSAPLASPSASAAAPAAPAAVAQPPAAALEAQPQAPISAPTEAAPAPQAPAMETAPVQTAETPNPSPPDAVLPANEPRASAGAPPIVAPQAGAPEPAAPESVTAAPSTPQAPAASASPPAQVAETPSQPDPAPPPAAVPSAPEAPAVSASPPAQVAETPSQPDPAPPPAAVPSAPEAPAVSAPPPAHVAEAPAQPEPAPPPAAVPSAPEAPAASAPPPAQVAEAPAQPEPAPPPAAVPSAREIPAASMPPPAQVAETPAQPEPTPPPAAAPMTAPEPAATTGGTAPKRARAVRPAGAVDSLGEEECRTLGVLDNCPDLNAVLDRLLERPLEYNYPHTMLLGRKTDITLVLRTDWEGKDLPTEVSEELRGLPGEVKQGLSKITRVMSAELTGREFDISPSNRQERTVVPPQPVSWSWQVSPTDTGQTKPLKLRLYAHLQSGGGTMPPILVKTLDASINVDVTTWDWVVNQARTLEPIYAIGAALLGLLTAILTYFLTRRREPAVQGSYREMAGTRDSGPVIGDLGQSATDRRSGAAGKPDAPAGERRSAPAKPEPSGSGHRGSPFGSTDSGEGGGSDGST